MNSMKHRAILLAFLSTSALTPLAATKAMAAVGSSDPLAVTFAQDQSDIKADPGARFGRLANGMTYVIYKNATPAGVVSVHLRIAAGSLMEGDQERGLAHFIEHMAFNGTTNIKTDDLIPMLQRRGIKLGPDVEAYTLPNKTEFMLGLPKNDDDSIDTALFVLREFAGNLTFEPAAVERERAVVLGEERLRETAPVLAQSHWLGAAFPGQKYATRGNPIGLPEIIKTATPATLRGYYDAFYRPELATLVVAGDVDPDKIEAKIKAKFGDWTPHAQARAVDFVTYQAKGETTFVEQAKSLPDTLTVTWFSPFDGTPETRKKANDNITDAFIVAALNVRLQHQAQQPDSAFAAASVGLQQIYQTAKVLQLGVAPKPGRDKVALDQALAVVHQFADKGVTLAEIAPIEAQYDAFFTQNVVGDKTRDTGAIASAIISNIDENTVFSSAETDLDAYKKLEAGLTQDTLDARLKALFAADGPLLSHTAEDMAGLDAPALKASFAADMSSATASYAMQETKVWPYTDFGPQQKPLSETVNKAFGYRQYTFANGVKLNVLPTKLKDNQILVQVDFRGGLQAISPATAAPIMFTGVYAGMGGYFGGALGKLSMEDLQKTLSGKTLGISYALAEDNAVISGATTKSDFQTEMQLLMAFTSDAAYRPAFYNQVHGVLPAVYAQVDGSPQGVLQTQFAALTHVNDKRYVFPDLATAQGVGLDQIKDVIQSSIQGRPITITIVGDIDPEGAKASIGSTFADLRAPHPVSGFLPGKMASFPAAGGNQTFYHNGRADQSVSVLAWPVPDATSDAKRSRTLQVLAEIINERAFETVREKLGQAYDANASVAQSFAFKGYGYLQVSGSVATGQDAAFVAAVNSIVDDLKSRPVSQDELDRARKPVVERAQTSRKDNGYWLGAIAASDDDLKRQSYFRDEVADLNAVSTADVQEAAKAYFQPAKVLHVMVLPRASQKQ